VAQPSRAVSVQSRPAAQEPFDNELILAYWKHASAYYGFGHNDRGDEACLRSALRLLRHFYGCTTAATFGPLALKTCRSEMIKKGWSRTYTKLGCRGRAAAGTPLAKLVTFVPRPPVNGLLIDPFFDRCPAWGYRQASLAAGETRWGGNRLAGHPEALGLPPDESGTALALTSWLHPEPMPACRS
jgi:hypothetical protein